MEPASPSFEAVESKGGVTVSANVESPVSSPCTEGESSSPVQASGVSCGDPSQCSVHPPVIL
jgi:hypothetical protein